MWPAACSLAVLAELISNQECVWSDRQTAQSIRVGLQMKSEGRANSPSALWGDFFWVFALLVTSSFLSSCPYHSTLHFSDPFLYVSAFFLCFISLFLYCISMSDLTEDLPVIPVEPSQLEWQHSNHRAQWPHSTSAKLSRQQARPEFFLTWYRSDQARGLDWFSAEMVTLQCTRLLKKQSGSVRILPFKRLNSTILYHLKPYINQCSSLAQKDLTGTNLTS